MERVSNSAQQNAPATQGCTDAQGKLPSCAPLANPYVPYQSERPDAYNPAKGIVRGTMYPGLDLPFMGMVNQSELSNTLMHQIQSLSFATTELGLYLDTHADDDEALDLFNRYRELYGELMAEYEAKRGPLTMQQAGANGSYDWVNDPWPWEYKANDKEG
ncbi:MAG: spore coat protein CotJB [Oscillospiraceae bacterium]|nr:spore coat protein CotJB [Oscillospiraceae bacterium]